MEKELLKVPGPGYDIDFENTDKYMKKDFHKKKFNVIGNTKRPELPMIAPDKIGFAKEG